MGDKRVAQECEEREIWAVSRQAITGAMRDAAAHVRVVTLDNKFARLNDTQRAEVQEIVDKMEALREKYSRL